MFLRMLMVMAAASASLLSAAGAAGQSFRETLAAAYQANPDLQAQRFAVRAAAEAVPRARGGRLPSVSADVGYEWSETDSDWPPTDVETILGTGPEGAVSREGYVYGLTASQSLYAGGRVSGAVDAAIARLRQAQATYRSAEQAVLLQAATAYLDVRRNARIVELQAASVAVLRRQLNAARERFAARQVTRTDTAQAEARLAAAQSQLAAARALLTTSRARFTRITGLTPAGSLAPAPALLIGPRDLETALLQAEQNNPRNIAAEFALEAASADITQSQAGVRPNVSFSLRYSHRENAREGSMADPDTTDETRAAVTLSVPLFSGGSGGAAVREARHTASSQRLSTRATKLLVREDTIAAWTNLEAASAQIRAITQQTAAAETAFEGVQAEARVGQRSVLDILDAQQELLDAQIDLASAHRNARFAELTVLEAIGALTAAGLQLPTRLTEPEALAERSPFNAIKPDFLEAF